ncbi:ABC-2 type transport system ATP-binding protein [Anoxybacillus tengchongensis]|uniref:ABC-2 type transport system ATP-binding protein n=1 Tax=Anoxybacillus tengchongensis TaxID=576944 RepID=A0A7X0D9X0_9BACL|nr:ABC transporter ATP-binding protein [Anoxybacillus tengchongensis]MBB6176930.1 ABC-2 type transport system ATP-binding protein [Anoxybacillus tengchongensis]
MSIVHVNELTKMYKNNRGIEQVTFSIEEGEIFGFIGPNGAGKSTTIRTLLNFIYPTSGSATIFGKDIVKDAKEIRRHVGYLPSEVHYYDDMKVIDLLMYSAAFYKVSDQRLKQLAERLDLDIHKKIEDLSFGNRKKVGIVQALLHEPKLLILDEPTGGLDPLMQHTFFEVLLEERKKGVTIFFSSHILSEVQKLCDRVAIIKEGKLIQVETVEYLTKNHLKHVTVVFEEGQHVEFDLAGVVNKEVNGNEMTMLYKGDMNELIAQLHNVRIKDVSISEPSLEDVFMHYYEK